MPEIKLLEAKLTSFYSDRTGINITFVDPDSGEIRYNCSIGPQTANIRGLGYERKKDPETGILFWVRRNRKGGLVGAF